MVRVVIWFLLLATFVCATTLEDKIESFIGEKEYKIQKNLIRILFKNKNSFLKEDSSVDGIKVLEKLKKKWNLEAFLCKTNETKSFILYKRESTYFYESYQ